jgi:outer membrane biosynthesis protein TonB
MVTPVRHDISDPAIPEGMVRISAGAEHRFIWPVHLGGWQSLGWQLQEAAADLPIAPTGVDMPGALTGSTPEELLPGVAPIAPLAPEGEEVAQPLLAVEPEAVPEAEWELEPQPEPAPEPEPEAVPAPMPAPDFQAMTKAQILEHCSSVYGVELDGSATKAELVEQATALAQLPVELLDGPSHA